MSNQILKLREASAVRRCHTLPHVGEYTVGKHSYDMAILLIELHPNPSRPLLMAVLYHDLAERWTGDIPCPATWKFQGLRDAYEKAQEDVMTEQGIRSFTLTPEENQWLIALDKLELWCWAQDQVNRWGNTTCGAMLDKLHQWFATNVGTPLQIVQFMDNYKWEAWT